MAKKKTLNRKRSGIAGSTAKRKVTQRKHPRRQSRNVETMLAIIEQIPPGCVATYGQIASLAGVPKNSRQVGSILSTLPQGSKVPWYRVVNSKGEISQRGDKQCVCMQRQMLEAEGVSFDSKGRVEFEEFRWQP